MEISATPLQARLMRQIPALLREAGPLLPELELAERAGVSRTPVREVLRRLERQGVVAHEKGRGYRLLEHAVPEPAAGGLLDDRMLRDLAAGALEPLMSERALMQRYGVARGELISTLRRLMRDGLAAPAVGRGWSFTAVGPEALAESYRFRQIVEPAALLADGYGADPALLAAMLARHRAALEGLEGMERRTLFDLDADFHLLLARGAGTGQLVQAIEKQNNLRRVAEYISYARLERIRASMEEHCRVLEALLRGERQTAAALLRLHLQVSAQETFHHLDEDLGRAPLPDHR